MLLVFQFPIADVRSFFREQGKTKISLTREMHASLRGFGAKRPKDKKLTGEERDLLALWLGEDDCYTMKQGLKFECKYKDEDGREAYRQLNENSLEKKAGIHGLKVAFRHFHFMRDDAQCDGIGRFEIGFFLQFPDDGITLRQIRDACAAIANLQTRQYKIGPFAEPPDPKRTDVYNPLYNSCGSIKNYFCASTTLLREKRHDQVQWRKREKLNSFPHTGYIKEGIPVFIATLAGNEVLCLPGNGGSVERRGIAWLYSDVPMNKKGDDTRGLFVLEESHGEMPGRRKEVRRCLSEINTQYQGLNLVMDLMQKHKAASRPRSDEMQAFQKFSTCVAKKMKDTLDTIKKHNAFDTAFLIEPDAVAGHASLFRKLEDMDDEIKKAQRDALLKASRRQTAKLVKSMLAEAEGVNMSIVIVESGGKYVGGDEVGRDKTGGDKVGGDKVVKFKIAVSGDTGTLKNNQLAELSELVKMIPGVPEDLKAELKRFIEQASTSKTEQIDSNSVKTLGEKLIGAAEKAQKFVVPVTACVKCIAALFGVPMP